jgi:YD repeat-containing protein
MQSFAALRWIVRVTVGASALVTCLFSEGVQAATTYLYDPQGRLTAIIYDNGNCVAYSYDADGNRTSSRVAINAAGSLTWGSGLWGCRSWSSS